MTTSSAVKEVGEGGCWRRGEWAKFDQSILPSVDLLDLLLEIQRNLYAFGCLACTEDGSDAWATSRESIAKIGLQ